MQPNDYFRYLEQELADAAKAATEETAKEIETHFRANIPARRIETRRAVRHTLKQEPDKLTIHFGLHFRRRFKRIQDTQTERIYYSAWRRIRPRVIVTLEKYLNQQLRSI